ncbi:hypothetical protein [Streptomyces hydrogenans]
MSFTHRMAGLIAVVPLAIVRAIAEGHRGGSVELRPTPDDGATFVLAFEE